MSTPHEKSPTPAYGSFKTLMSFLNDIRDEGHVPLQIDRSLMTKLSGSAKGETLATLRFFGLTDHQDVPTKLFERFAMATDEERKKTLPEVVRNAYSFVFDAPNFHVERATGQQVSELFRAHGVSGSTLVRAMSLFLAAAKEADIKVSPSIKPPKNASNGSRPKKKAADEPGPKTNVVDGDPAPVPPRTHRFELPIPGKPSVQVLVPESLDAADWDMLSQMFGIYVARWKGYQSRHGSEVVEKPKKEAPNT